MPQIKCSSTNCLSNQGGVCAYAGDTIQITAMGCQNFDPKAAMEALEQGGGTRFGVSHDDFLACLPYGGGAEGSADWTGPDDQSAE